ncbi:hypothetical protein ACEPAI_7480 [Sanghuangporus weigelae]
MACLRCGGSPGRLSTCSRCKRISYCDENCQKADYRAHKQFCRAWSTMRANEPVIVMPKEPQSREAYQTFVLKRTNWSIIQLETLIGRPLDKLEQQIVTMEPRCSVCFKTDHDLRKNPEYPGQQLTCCQTCFAIYSCSDRHEQMIRNRHAFEPYEPGGQLTRCRMQLLVLVDDDDEAEYCRHSAKPVWYPERRLLKYKPLATYSTENAWVEWSSRPENDWPYDSSLELRRSSAYLTYPMTVLYGMELFDQPESRSRMEENPGSSVFPPAYQPFLSRSHLEIHIIGVRGNDLVAKQALVFEELHHLLPECKQLTLRFIGPDLGDFPTLCLEVPLGFDNMGFSCADCRTNGLVRIQSMHSDTYYEWTQEQRQTNGSGAQAACSIPDLVICFNALMTDCAELRVCWAPTINLLLDMGVPTVVTAFTQAEARNDMEFMEKLGGRVTWEPRRNPWRNLQALPEYYGNDEFYFLNNHMIGVCGRMTESV